MQSKLSLVKTSLKTGANFNDLLVRLALRDALQGCESVLDVGCGVSMALRQIGIPQTTGAEGYLPSLQEATRLRTHDRLIQCDVRDLTQHFQPGQFDACIAMDVIEHLEKKDGLKLMADMEKIARKKIVFFTPSGFLPQRQLNSDDLQSHLSGWEATEMEQFGYRVTGQLGPKGMRGEYHVLKKKPAAFWGMVSLAGQVLWSKNHPAQATAIFCVKTKG